MQDSDNEIFVSFVQYEPYEQVPNIIATLGTLPVEKILKLHKKLGTQKMKKNSCVDRITAEYTNTRYLCYDKWHKYCDSSSHSSYNLYGMFYMHEEYLPPCAGHKKPKTEEQMIRMCARNLRHGRCVDEYMKKTLGVALFPDKYAKEHQK